MIRSEAGLLAVGAQVYGGPLALPPPLPEVDYSARDDVEFEERSQARACEVSAFS